MSPIIEPLVALIENRLRLICSQDQLHVSHCLGLSLVAAAASAHRGCVQVEGVRRQVTNAVQIFTPLPPSTNTSGETKGKGGLRGHVTNGLQGFQRPAAKK